MEELRKQLAIDARRKKKNRKAAKKNKKKKSNVKNRNRKKEPQLFKVYGDYHCLYCNLRWCSTRTLQTADRKRLYAQQCECGYDVFAYYVHNLCRDCKNYPCRCEERVFGYYECRRCRKRWQSAYTFVEKGTTYAIYGQQCKRCKLNNFAVETKRLERNKNPDSKKNHIQSLCGRCKYKSVPCTFSY
eukprot:222119_1